MGKLPAKTEIYCKGLEKSGIDAKTCKKIETEVYAQEFETRELTLGALDFLASKHAPKEKVKMVTYLYQLAQNPKDFFEAIRTYNKKAGKWKKACVGIIAAGAVYLSYVGASYLVSHIKEISSHERSVHQKVDLENFATEKNREQHIKNIESYLESYNEYKQVKDVDGVNGIRGIVKKIYDVVAKKDLDFEKQSPHLYNRFKVLEGCGTIKSQINPLKQ
jgi:hypothetical protein